MLHSLSINNVQLIDKHLTCTAKVAAGWRVLACCSCCAVQVFDFTICDCSSLTHDNEILMQECKVGDTGRAKGMMAERLAVSEGKLMKLHHDEVIKNLVAAKMELAQSRFESLEIQVSSTALQETACALL